MKDNRDQWKVLRFIIISLNKLTVQLKKIVGRVNQNREGKYSDSIIAMVAGGLSLVLLVLMLFVPPFLGMSDDGSFARVINPAGIYHMEAASENLYFNYYVREYLSLAPEGGVLTGITCQRAMIYTAKWLDSIFTRDSIFDLRFLALLYALLYIPAVMLLVKQAAARAKTFTECMVIGLVGVVIFSDVSYVTYFSSFFTEPLVFVSMLICTGSALALQKEKHNIFYLVLYTLFGMALTTIEDKYAAAGLILGLLGVKFVFVNKALLWRIGCITAVLSLFLSTMFSVSYAPSSFTTSGKFHAMTRGVLLQSTDPEKTLEEFGIDSSYSILADASSNDRYPLIKPDSRDLLEGFYDRYSPAKIAFFYLRHPTALVAMLDISVKAAFNFRRDFSGNYEKSAGMPKKAKSLFWSAWSSFKANSLPKTIGFLAVLLLALILLFRQKAVRLAGSYRLRSSIPLEVMLIIFLMGISNAIVTIVNSGDTEMTRHLFLFSVTLDIIMYYSFSELLHKLRIL
ncbi:hypothetical protein CLHUN_11440 [Ruminiclostridium hungatei]|uniref:Glycosyltransferase RgtA/B/C/D-like domain-containing protein n=1 Tax=Ruminiclostridium hungatei TaxID=48256 RepID=A0A1V4SM02_RUMHU|nr:hypothetical protein [Ruminiclostridium hungatei]OPX44912.1 hypothetical protein CLHUN_11440 [Ruminiclostridium hungatei]